jgi:hypothetical protein
MGKHNNETLKQVNMETFYGFLCVVLQGIYCNGKNQSNHHPCIIAIAL